MNCTTMVAKYAFDSQKESVHKSQLFVNQTILGCPQCFWFTKKDLVLNSHLFTNHDYSSSWSGKKKFVLGILRINTKTVQMKKQYFYLAPPSLFAVSVNAPSDRRFMKIWYILHTKMTKVPTLSINCLVIILDSSSQDYASHIWPSFRSWSS